jgi:lipid A 3-O-deacylase
MQSSRLNIVLAAGLSCFAASPSIRAGDRIVPSWLHEVKLGVLHHDTGLWSGAGREIGMDVNLEAIFSPQVQFLGGFIRPAFGGSVNATGDTSKLYAGLRWQYEHASGIFFGVGGGGAVHDGKLHLQPSNDRAALGSRVLFHIPFELGYRFNHNSALSAYFDHVSNAYLANPNEGLDTLGARYGYRF